MNREQQFRAKLAMLQQEGRPSGAMDSGYRSDLYNPLISQSAPANLNKGTVRPTPINTFMGGASSSTQGQNNMMNNPYGSTMSYGGSLNTQQQQGFQPRVSSPFNPQNLSPQSPSPYSPMSTSRYSPHSPGMQTPPYSPTSGPYSPGSSMDGQRVVTQRPAPVNSIPDTNVYGVFGGSSGSIPTTAAKRGRVYMENSYNSMISHSDSSVSIRQDGPDSVSPDVAIKKKKANPQRLKKTPNSFMLFAQDYRKKCKQEHPQLSNSTISILLGRKWKNLEATEKEFYIQKAAKMKEEFELQHPDFSYGSSGKKLKRRRARRANSEPPRPVLTQWEQERHFRNMVTPQLTPNNAQFTKEQLQQEFSSLQEFLTAEGPTPVSKASPSSSPMTSPGESPRNDDSYSRSSSVDIRSPSSPAQPPSQKSDQATETQDSQLPSAVPHGFEYYPSYSSSAPPPFGEEVEGMSDFMHMDAPKELEKFETKDFHQTNPTEYYKWFSDTT